MATGFGFFTEESVLKVETRRKLLELIRKSPGLHFREIKRRTQLGDGSLKYNLDVLSRFKLIESLRLNDSLRFYPPGISSEEKVLIGFLRQKSPRNILLFLMNRSNANHGDLVKALGLVPSSVSWHLKSLENHGIIKTEKTGREHHYIVTDEQLVVRVLQTYKESLLDRLTDNFASLWDIA